MRIYANFDKGQSSFIINFDKIANSSSITSISLAPNVPRFQRIKKLTKKEEEIMNLFWDKGAMFVKELLELYAEPKPHFNTLSTMVLGTVFIFPFSIVTQMLFVLSFKLMTVNIIELLKRTGGYRVRIQSTLLKKRQTQPSAVCLQSMSLVTSSSRPAAICPQLSWP